MWQQWLNLIVGLWLIISPYVLPSTANTNTNLIVSGVIVAVLAVWGALEHRSHQLPAERMS